MNNENPLDELLESKSLETVKFDREQLIAFRDRAREEGAAMERERRGAEKAEALSLTDADKETPDSRVQAVFHDAVRYQLLRRKVCIAGGKFQILNLDPTYCAPDAAIELDAVLDANILANKE